jgi:hypothetical protein
MFLIHIASDGLDINRVALSLHPGKTTGQEIEIVH